MSSQKCLHPFKINGHPKPCGKCSPCRRRKRNDIRVTTVKGIEHHKPQRLVFVTVTASATLKDLHRVRWNMNAGKLRNKLTPRMQSALTSRTQPLPLAWALGYQKNGSVHFHYLILLPEDCKLTTAQVRKRLKKAINGVKVIDTFDHYDTATGEIQAQTLEHSFGWEGTNVQLAQTTKDVAQNYSGYLGINAALEPWEEVSTRVRRKFHKIVGEQFDSTPKQVAGLGYKGHSSGRPSNWGSCLRERREERQRYAVEKAKQEALAVDLAVLAGSESGEVFFLEDSKDFCSQFDTETGIERDTGLVSESLDEDRSEPMETYSDPQTQTDNTRTHEVLREGVSCVSNDPLSNPISRKLSLPEDG